MSDDIGVVPPLIVKSDDGLLLFRSLNGARGYLEVPDVEAGVYGPAFDSRGLLIEIALPAPLVGEARGRGRLWKLLFGEGGRPFNAVVIRPAETAPTHQQDLIDLIASALPASALPTGDRDLPELIARATEHFDLLA